MDLGRKAVDLGGEKLAGKEPPAGVIFMCSNVTRVDCFKYKVFGMPSAHKELVERIVPGTRLFLFDISSKELSGIFEAVSHGGLNLEPDAFENIKGAYPAQVRFDMQMQCLPIPEDVLKDAIRENYNNKNKFKFELTAIQVARLIQLFRPVEPLLKRVDPSADIMPSSSEQQASVRASAVLPHHIFGGQEKLDFIRESASGIRHSMDGRFPVLPYADNILDTRFPVGDLGIEKLRRLSEVAPLSGLPHISDGGYLSLLGKRHTYERDYLDPLLTGSYGSAFQFPKQDSFNDDRIFSSLQLAQGKLIYDNQLPTASTLLQPNQIEEVDRLALRYVNNDPGFLGGQLSWGGSSNGLSAVPLGSHREYMDTGKIQSLTSAQLGASIGQLGVQQELSVHQLGTELAAGQFQSIAPQTARRKRLRKSRWDQETAEPTQLAASSAVIGSVSASIASSIVPQVGVAAQLNALAESSVPFTNFAAAAARQSLYALRAPLSGEKDAGVLFPGSAAARSGVLSSLIGASLSVPNAASFY
eukprot:c27254_g1_i1 orf=474-2060(-)